MRATLGSPSDENGFHESDERFDKKEWEMREHALYKQWAICPFYNRSFFNTSFLLFRYIFDITSPPESDLTHVVWICPQLFHCRKTLYPTPPCMYVLIVHLSFAIASPARPHKRDCHTCDNYGYSHTLPLLISCAYQNGYRMRMSRSCTPHIHHHLQKSLCSFEKIGSWHEIVGYTAVSPGVGT